MSQNSEGLPSSTPEYVMSKIDVTMDNLFDDDGGYWWETYTDAAGRLQVKIQDATDDSIRYYTLYIEEVD